MAIPKVCGIETEYGIHTVGGDGNPIAASSVLVNAYIAHADRRTRWDFEDESPGKDARGYAREDAMPPMVETHLANTVLTNGARFYVDHAHPEYSTPECGTPLELVIHDKAGEEVLRRSMTAAAAMFPDSPAVVVYKNNSDGKGNSYGCHENYLMDRAVPFAQVISGVVPHFVTRQVYAGAGKVGTETGALDRSQVAFQISQRAEFFEETVGLETTLKRPIVNTRDEPHADPSRFRRLHVIVGDANLSEVATLLKVGTTALVLAMIEDAMLPPRDLSLADPVRAMHRVSADLELSRPLELADGSTATALEIQWDLLERGPQVRRRARAVGAGRRVGGPGGARPLGAGPPRPRDRPLDPGPPARLGGQAPADGGLPGAPRLRVRRRPRWPRWTCSTTTFGPSVRCTPRLGMERLVDDAAVAEAVTVPPRDTRAWFRGQCLARWPEAVVTANWDSLVFDLGTDPLRRVPMMDPLKGTADHTEALLDASASPTDLLERLTS